MPAIVVASIIAGGAGLATSALGARAQGSASRRATDASERSNADALAFERENEARRREEYDRSEALAKQAWEAEQARQERLDTEETRRFGITDARASRDEARSTRAENFDRTRYNANAPYRATGRAALGQLASLAGLTVGAGDTVPMVPDAPPASPAPAGAPVSGTGPTTAPPSAPPMAPPPSAPARPPIDLVSGQPPPPDVTPDADGLVPVRMSADAYTQLTANRSPLVFEPKTRPTMSALVQRRSA